MSHSPGPWSFKPRVYPEKYTPPRDEQHVLGIWDATGFEIVTTDSGYYGPNIDDARLISAAPDLLAACKQVLSWEQEHPRGAQLRISALLEPVIAKAEGQ